MIDVVKTLMGVIKTKNSSNIVRNILTKNFQLKKLQTDFWYQNRKIFSDHFEWFLQLFPAITKLKRQKSESYGQKIGEKESNT